MEMTTKEKLIEEKRGQILEFKNLLEQGDYKARKLILEICRVVKKNFPDEDMPVFEKYEAVELEAEEFRAKINVLEDEIKELEK